MPDKNNYLQPPPPAPETEHIPDNLKICFGDYGHMATANRPLPTAGYHLAAPKPEPKVYNFDLGDIIGTHTPIHYTDATGPDPEEIKKHLIIAFQKMFAQINDILDTVNISENEPQPFIWPYPPEPQGKADDPTPHFRPLLANELFNPLEAHKYIEHYNADKEQAVPLKAQGRKISPKDAEKIEKYIKSLRGNNDKAVKNVPAKDNKQLLDLCQKVDNDKSANGKYSNYNLSPEGVKFVQLQEGFVDHVYNDGRGAKSDYYKEKSHTFIYNGKNKEGNPTVGYGHLLTAEELSRHKWSNGITKKEAQSLFLQDKSTMEKGVSKLIHVPLKTYQFDAIVDFAYNAGLGKDQKGGLAGSDFLKELNKGNFNADLLLHYKYPIERRKDQVTLFKTGQYQFRGKVIK